MSVTAQMKRLRMIMARTTQDFGLQVSKCIIDPLTAGGAYSFVAGITPSIRPWVLGTGRPKEADPRIAPQTINDVLTNQRFLLKSVALAVDVPH